VAAILLILAALYINTEHIIREQEQGIANYKSATDEQSRAIRNELEQYLHSNKSQQRNIVYVGIVIVAVAGIWWVLQRRSSDRVVFRGWLRRAGLILLLCAAGLGVFLAVRPTMLQLTAHRSPAIEALSPRARLIVEGALAEVENGTRYEETYTILDYPGGDVPADIGVCTDLVIRAFRNAGIDLQKEVHEDRLAHPEAYPVYEWEEKEPNWSIDHRRCRNLAVWFARFGETLPTQWNADTKATWQPGDVVFFAERGEVDPTHVAIVSNKKTWRGMPFRIESTKPKTMERRPIIYAPILSGARVHSHYRLVGEF
jgi:uncharacterized protein YijF (DUF1287 family)